MNSPVIALLTVLIRYNAISAPVLDTQLILAQKNVPVCSVENLAINVVPVRPLILDNASTASAT